MTTHEQAEHRLRELTTARFKDYANEVLQSKSWAERDSSKQAAREKRRRDFVASLGIDLERFDAALKKDDHAQEEELKSFLAEFRTKSTTRRSLRAADSRAAASLSQTQSETGHLVLPAVASSLFAADKSLLADIGGLEWINGPINSGWVFPDDPSLIRIKDSRHYPNAMCWDNRQTPYPEFAAHFTFIPAETGSYEMTAVLAFHGFYVLRSDDSWWNCRDAGVRLTVQSNVHQNSDIGWKDFPTLLDVEKDNTEEVTNFDRTFFLDYTAQLRGGEPVIVTAKGVVQAYAHGAGAYAELNFADGSANYISPLFLSVQKV
jgi:hypothetical protein